MEFMLERGMIDAIFKIRQMMKKYEAAGKNLYMLFGDLKNAFDCVPREVIHQTLRGSSEDRNQGK